MSDLSNVVIVMARCSHNKSGFGIRFEEKLPGQWIADWSFTVKDVVAKREGYDRGEIAGAFELDIVYPGCSYCHAKSIFKCGCGKVACWDSEQRTVTCPWCGNTGELSGTIESLGAGADR